MGGVSHAIRHIIYILDQGRIRTKMREQRLIGFRKRKTPCCGVFVYLLAVSNSVVPTVCPQCGMHYDICIEEVGC